MIFVCIFIFHQSQLLPKPQTIIQVIPPGDIRDQRILQSNCLKAFPAVTQEQEFPQIYDLHCKIDNINFIYVRFHQKSMTKIFEIKEKPGFWVIFEHTFLPEGNFS